MSNGVATSENVKVQVSKVIHAKRQRVYDAWTKPEMIQQWFGPARMQIVSARTDLRVGGSYRVEMQGPGRGADSPDKAENTAIATGVYQTIIPDELLSFTWQGNWEPAEETLVTVQFKDAEGGTEVTLIHERFTTIQSMEGHRHGWTESLEKLAAFCER